MDDTSQNDTETHSAGSEFRKEDNGFFKPVSKRPDVYSYVDYKEFLKDMLCHFKTKDKAFSLRRFSKSTGLSTGYLPVIFGTSQHLAQKSIDKILPSLHLTPSEAQFFRLLREMADAADPEKREDVLRRLQRSRRFRKENSADAGMIKYLESWHHIAIKEMAFDPEFRAEPTWIQSRLQFHVGLADIQDALTFLFDEGFLIKLNDGKFRTAAKQLDCRDEIYRMALMTSHKQFFDLAGESMVTVPREEREILGHSMPIDEEGYEKAKQILRKALSDIAKLEPKEGKKMRVANFALVAFPLTRSEKE